MNAIPQNNNVNEQEKVPYTFGHAVLKYPEETKGLVSIIIPIYNTGLYLKEALDSVIAQTFENWEAILVDDGSTDESPKICIEYAEKDSRFIYVCKEKNEGLLLARKTGLENSRGEFVANLDSDDIYKPQFLEKMLAKIKEGNNDFVYCDFERLDGINLNVITCYNFSENKLENCRNIRSISPSVWNKLIRRNVYVKVLFPKVHIVYGEDFIQSVSILCYSKNAKFIMDKLYVYRTNSLTSTIYTFNTVSKEKRCIQRVVYTIAVYLLMEQFFGIEEAEIAFADENNFGNFGDYFLLDRSAIVKNKIEYADNFIPVFLKGLKKTKSKSLKEKLRKLSLILACKEFPLLFKILRKVKEIYIHMENLWKRK